MIHRAQHGIRSGHSTTTNLVEFVDSLLVGMSTFGQVDTLYTDFSKAFDQLGHSRLIKILEVLGVGGKMLDWLASYFLDRTMLVRICSAPTVISHEVRVLSGVPQRSHLGPPLFALFVNDFLNDYCLKNCEFLMYAENLKLFKKITGPSGLPSDFLVPNSTAKLRGDPRMVLQERDGTKRL